MADSLAVTTDANEKLRPLHDRMPVVVEEADWPVWLGEQEGNPSALLRPAAEDVLVVVSPDLLPNVSSWESKRRDGDTLNFSWTLAP
jgi:putative SOS response-associated peptidase YedK